MAPKGGGRGGGGGGIGGGIDLNCSGSAFKSSPAKTVIAFAAIFLVVYLVSSCLVPTRKRRVTLGLDPPGKKRMIWSLLRITIAIQILASIVFIAGFVIAQCGSANRSLNDILTARQWLDGIAIVALYGIILVPLCKNMHEVSGSLLPKLVVIGHSVVWVAIALLQLISLAIITALRTAEFTSMETVQQLYKASKGITTTYDVFALLGMGVAAASILVAVIRSSELKKGVVLLWAASLIVGSIGLTLLELAFFINFTLMENVLKADAESAYYVLRCLFWATMFLSVVFISGSRNMAKGGDTQYGVPPVGAAPGYPPPQPQQPGPMMGYNPNPAPTPAPMSPAPNNGAAAYPAPYNDTTASSPHPQNTTSPPPQVPYPQNTTSPPPASYPQSTASPPPPAAYNNNPSYTPYNGGNVNYTSVDAPPPPQPYYH